MAHTTEGNNLLGRVMPRVKKHINVSLMPCSHDTFPNRSRAIDRERFAACCPWTLPVSTREKQERLFRFLDTTSRYGTSGREPFAIGRVRLTLDARPKRQTGAINTRLFDPINRRPITVAVLLCNKGPIHK